MASNVEDARSRAQRAEDSERAMAIIAEYFRGDDRLFQETLMSALNEVRRASAALETATLTPPQARALDFFTRHSLARL